LGVPGWLGLAAIFVAAGLIYPHIVRWGLPRAQTRRRYAATASGAKTTMIPALQSSERVIVSPVGAPSTAQPVGPCCPISGCAAVRA
jgi:hypothetical protein